MSSRNSNDSDFGKRLRQLRKHEGLSQGAFGKRVGCGADNISKIELGDSRPSPAVLLNIYREFKGSEDYLRTGQAAIYKVGSIEADTDAETPADYRDSRTRDRESRNMFEELLGSNDDKILNHLAGQLDLLLELLARKKREPGG